MEQELLSLLRATAALTAVVPANRIGWDDVAQGLGYPCIVLNLVGGQDGAHMNGPNDLFEGRIQIDCYALTRPEAAAAAAQTLSLLHFYRGGGFQGVFHAGTRRGREGGTNEAERPYGVSLDFTIAWREDNG